MKALVVDSSVVMRRVLTGALARVGIADVDQAITADEAVHLAASNSYRIILMDWNLPDEPGIDALRSIRSAGITTSIIMVSAEAKRGKVLEALHAGANSYVIKPFDRATIVSKIQAVLQPQAPGAAGGEVAAST